MSSVLDKGSFDLKVLVQNKYSDVNSAFEAVKTNSSTLCFNTRIIQYFRHHVANAFFQTNQSWHDDITDPVADK